MVLLLALACKWLHINKKQGYNLVNKVASVYGKDNAEIKFQGWKNDGLLRWEKNKSQSVLTSAGLQSPMEKSKIGSSGVNLNNSQQTVNNQKQPKSNR
ncbi:hypothetical protein HT665_01385 [Ursidibacter maritimus]|uniref:Uncharacterized protein n=1 Tax=Ursidibacter maritimus TaxID=1331689 RepID=A0A949T4F5_9PAST|nr:hypothetical protein A1D26_04245 [Ursidibacter maritimus]MBV6524597.1 hypothetical protein [Ursidibacter maritimus]MBV6525428.1 hypothetical protein [Ursidibacter maritimus]MBV6526898.1 hypothetical protein [Ursidibacter maritimus]MBV6530279.1 hypothetical protein [Ursidibacter maritimus]